MKISERDDFLNKTEFAWYAGFGSEFNPMKNKNTSLLNHARRSKTMLDKYGVTSNWKRPEHSTNMSKLATLRNTKQVNCPHCGKIGGFVNMRRYHFNNCKQERENDGLMG